MYFGLLCFTDEVKNLLWKNRLLLGHFLQNHLATLTTTKLVTIFVYYTLLHSSRSPQEVGIQTVSADRLEGHVGHGRRQEGQGLRRGHEQISRWPEIYVFEIFCTFVSVKCTRSQCKLSYKLYNCHVESPKRLNVCTYVHPGRVEPMIFSFWGGCIATLSRHECFAATM
jgi:hypothetical protein